MAGISTVRGVQIAVASGFSDAEQTEPLAVDDRFPIASVTKPFTATVILKLVEEGVLSLEDTLAERYPSFAGGESIKIKNLMNHTSGIANFTDDPAVLARLGEAWDHDELVATQAARGLLFEPGSRYSYSNTNYILLGLIIERATGSTYATELKRRILPPLRLTQTYLDGEGDLRGFVPGARLTSDGYVRLASPFHPSLTWAAGWCRTRPSFSAGCKHCSTDDRSDGAPSRP